MAGGLLYINRFIELFVSTVRQMGRGRLWLILLPYLLLNWLILYALYQFRTPWFSDPVLWFVSLFGENAAERFNHYPGQFLVLPYYFGWARFYLALPLEGLVLGIVAARFNDSFRGLYGSERSTVRSVLPRWIHLVFAWMIINGLMLAAGTWLRPVFQPYLTESPRMTLIFELTVLPLIYVIIAALFYFLFSAIVVFGDSILGALRRSIVTFGRNPFTCLALAGIVFFMPILFSVIISHTDTIVSKFRPEVVYWLLLSGLVVDVFAWFVWIGTSVKFLNETSD